jgi:hypothetical protein
MQCRDDTTLRSRGLRLLHERGTVQNLRKFANRFAMISIIAAVPIRVPFTAFDHLALRTEYRKPYVFLNFGLGAERSIQDHTRR